jgi:hypothetical protein
MGERTWGGGLGDGLSELVARLVGSLRGFQCLRCIRMIIFSSSRYVVHYLVCNTCLLLFSYQGLRSL